jgi:hypothetical protein
MLPSFKIEWFRNLIFDVVLSPISRILFQIHICWDGLQEILSRQIRLAYKKRVFTTFILSRNILFICKIWYVFKQFPVNFIVRLKFQYTLFLKFVSRIPILSGHSGGYNTPQLAAELFSKLALVFIPVIEFIHQLVLGLLWNTVL